MKKKEKTSKNYNYELECYWDGELTSIYKSNHLNQIEFAKRIDIDSTPLGSEIEFKLIKNNEKTP